jgi:hypothetical protein
MGFALSPSPNSSIPPRPRGGFFFRCSASSPNSSGTSSPHGPRKAEGNHACGEVSLGYRKNGEGKLEPDPETPPIVRRIFQLRDEGESLRSIAERLNADDVETKSGGEWHASTVKYVPDNPKYGDRLRHAFDGTAVEKDVERLKIE